MNREGDAAVRVIGPGRRSRRRSNTSSTLTFHRPHRARNLDASRVFCRRRHDVASLRWRVSPEHRHRFANRMSCEDDDGGIWRSIRGNPINDHLRLI